MIRHILHIISTIRNVHNTLPSRLRRVTSSKRYIPEIDGLRFLAILPVLIQHFSERLLKYTPSDVANSWIDHPLIFWASRGTVGVFLFFTISGFILALPFGNAIKSDKPMPSYGSYFKRRLTRLEPPYIVWMILFTMVLAYQSNQSMFDLLPSLMASLFYIHNIGFGSYSPINPVAWSLEVEFQFYLLAPFIALLFFSIRNKVYRRYILWTIILLVPLLQDVFAFNSMPWKASILGQLQHFILGFLLADIYLENKLVISPKNFIWDGMAIVAIIVMALSWSDEWIKEGFFSIAVCLLFMATFNGRVVNAIMRNTWITAIGGMCYTIYLIHLPLMELLVSKMAPLLSIDSHIASFTFQLLLVIPMILGVSAFFYLLFEKPFMNPKWYSHVLQKIKQIPIQIKIPMISKKTFLITLVIVLSQPQSTWAQLSPSDPANLNLVDLDLNNPENMTLMPVEEMIDLAVQNSPLIKSQEVKMSNFENELKLINRKWTEYLSVGGSLLYGSSFFVDATEGSLGLNDFSTLSRNNTVSNVSMVARIPLSELFNRKVKNDKIINQQLIEQYNTQSMIRSLREVIVNHYNTLNTKIEALSIKSKEVESLRLAVSLAEEYLRSGNMEVSEYTATISRLSKAEYEMLTYQSQAKLAFLMLQEIIGKPIAEPKTN